MFARCHSVHKEIWNPNFIQKIQWIVSVTLLKVKQAFFSTFAFNIYLQVNHITSITLYEWWKLHLFLLSMKFIVSAASYHAQCLHHNYDNYIFNNTDQMHCFCSLCVNAWAHNVQKICSKWCIELYKDLSS